MDTLAPGLLVAAPNLQDAVFARTVILLAEANDGGAIGFVLNKPLEVTFADLSRELKVTVAEGQRDRNVLFGGPVSPERGWVLFAGADSEDAPFAESSLPVFSGVRMSPTMEALHGLLSSDDSPAFRLVLGHAGWGPGQLQDELTSGSWIPLPVSPDLLFEIAPADLWDTAIGRLGITPGLLVGGGARA